MSFFPKSLGLYSCASPLSAYFVSGFSFGNTRSLKVLSYARIPRSFGVLRPKRKTNRVVPDGMFSWSCRSCWSAWLAYFCHFTASFSWFSGKTLTYNSKSILKQQFPTHDLVITLPLSALVNCYFWELTSRLASFRIFQHFWD